MIITVANQKGGSGKTTTAVNLAACLADKGYTVLLVDLDPQGAASTSLGIDIWSIGASTFSLITKTSSVAQTLRLTPVPKLYLVPSNLNLAGAELAMANEVGREHVLKQVLSLVNCDHVIIDTPPTLGLLTLNALVAADLLIVPLQCEFFALVGTDQLLKIMKMVEERLNHRIMYRILLTMYDSRTNLSKEVVRRVKEQFPNLVLQTLIPRNIRLAEAPSYGQPITLYDPFSSGAMAYRALAEELDAEELTR